MKEFYIEQTKESLRNSIELISFEIEQRKNLDAFALEVKKALKLRLTIVDFEGNVIAESHKEKSKMDNHKYRYEIMQSAKQEFGYRIRYSKTTNKTFFTLPKSIKILRKPYT